MNTIPLAHIPPRPHDVRIVLYSGGMVAGPTVGTGGVVTSLHVLQDDTPFI